MLQILLFLSILFVNFQYVEAHIRYPVTFTTLRSLDPRRQPTDIARLMTVPGYRPSNFVSPYQFISFDGWTSKGNFASIEIWARADSYFGKQSRFGNSTNEIQSYIASLFHKNGTKLLVTAFSDYEFPAKDLNAQDTAISLAIFVNSNNLDGATIQFEDLTDQGGIWLSLFLRALRDKLPNKIIVLNVFASNFIQNSTLSQQISSISPLVDFYVLKYYNVLANDYNTIESLTAQSRIYKKTSILELMDRGIYGNKIVVGKPSSSTDTWNSQGYMELNVLRDALQTAYSKKGWYGGFSNNDLALDMTGFYAKSVTSTVEKSCDATAICI